ncbi:hypothetical protein [Actinoplanes regularis]|uniref:DUF3396 domain-containing protein n=1 Tax=Actinoplanes regularis TaxID=52697 RepID=A0A238XMJ4_9ACTN|nr:hypothetical protein [Actinoplanes regularis]GIE90530.1 hypothetical protein Are01nite_70100 [Actinoplanes regularis]SNR59199.1 hypothetical protein SAMN06264365_103522 [Actinoplanes regularis]
MEQAVHILTSLHVGDDPGGAATVARRWFELGWELLGGQLRAMVDGDDPVLAGVVAPRGFVTSMGAGTSLSYAEGQWHQFVAELDRLPDALFEVSPLIPAARPEFEWRRAAHFESPYFMSMRLDRYEPDVVNLVLKSRHELLFDGGAGESRIIAFLEDLVSIRAVDYAEVTYGHGGGEHTMQERDLGLSPFKSLPEARSVLRGFAWVTVIPAGIAARLGGAEALAATGAFFRVKALPHGEVWLQATEHFDDWNDEAAAKVFPVLTPFLPAGTMPLAYRYSSDSVRAGNVGKR